MPRSEMRVVWRNVPRRRQQGRRTVDLYTRSARQHVETPQPAGAHGGLAASAFGMDQDGLGRRGGLDEILGRLSDASLGRRQAQLLAHRARQEGVDGRAARPDPLLQTG